MNLDFLSSNRFWAIVVGAVVIYLQTKGYIGQAEMILIDSILGGHVILKTIDRAAEKSGGADTA